jgi:hypothetical protein
MSINPPRVGASVYGATEYVTVPLPLPLAPEVIVIQLALLAAVQVQPVGAVTFTLPNPPMARKDCLAGTITYVQGAPACVTVNVCPPIVTVPVRGTMLLV